VFAAARTRIREEFDVLVLSRHKDEVIMVGDNIRIVVVDIRGDKVRIGIQAPLDVPVHRLEIYEMIKKEEGEINGGE